MTQDILDILYTPVEIPTAPIFDREKFDEWCRKNSEQEISYRKDGSKNTSEDIYPWDITYAKNSFRWLGNFDKEFPELAEYFQSAFQLTAWELMTVVILPIKKDYTGATYWHADPDEVGLRLYLENNETDNDFLLIKPTTERNGSRDELGHVPEDGITNKVQEIIHSAKIPKSTRGFYINNVRAIHTVNVESPDLKRVAVLLITGKSAKNFPAKAADLILKSAEEFSDYAIKWTEPK